eukprot:1147787-Amphidinium_carterae.1
MASASSGFSVGSWAVYIPWLCTSVFCMVVLVGKAKRCKFKAAKPRQGKAKKDYQTQDKTTAGTLTWLHSRLICLAHAVS